MEKGDWSEELKVTWGEFIEHRPYFRQMSEEDWSALQCFVNKLLAGQQSELLKRLPTNEEMLLAVKKEFPYGNRREIDLVGFILYVIKQKIGGE